MTSRATSYELVAIAANSYDVPRRPRDPAWTCEWGGTGLRSHPTSTPVATTRVEWVVVTSCPAVRLPKPRRERSAAGDGELLAFGDLPTGERVELLDAVHHLPDVTGLGQVAGDAVERVAGLDLDDAHRLGGAPGQGGGGPSAQRDHQGEREGEEAQDEEDAAASGEPDGARSRRAG